MFSVLKREFIYVSSYFMIQLRQILPYWIMGMVLGSVISVFVKDKIHGAVTKLGEHKLGVFGIVLASVLGIASPLCMYGTIPLAASFSRKGIRDDWLAAFMMSSILLNPQLIIYSMALGKEVLAVRIITCFLCGIAAGLILRYGFKNKAFFNFDGFAEKQSRDTHPNLLIRLLKNIGRNFKATGVYFLFGVLLSALFQRYVPADGFAKLFGSEHQGFGLLMAATIGVPLYACGGGTIPLLQQWLMSGMSIGSAASFMLTGPSTKITNLGALKIVLGMKHFLLYLLYVMLFSLACGFVVNLLFL
ncbi:MAG: permease [Oscillospiraceae bacterium]|nr:permease [Oscillospiraceae bacterium]